MKNLQARWSGLLILFLSVSGFAQSPPAIPNEWFGFPPGFDTGWGTAPIAYTTNLLSTPMDPPTWLGNVLILDTTNLTPAFLNYNVLDTNYGETFRNISYGQGTVLFYFSPNWASVSHGGTGPGETAYFLAGGDWSSNSPNGLFAIYADASGSNLCFGGVGAGDAEIYASAPISWSSNTWHQIGVEYTGGDCVIYLDGALAATGDGVIYVPKRSTWTNGFFIGSDNTGYEQARGAFLGMVTWAEEYGAWYTYSWLDVSNIIAAWQGTLGGVGFGGMMGMGMSGGYGMAGGIGVLIPANGCGCNCVSNTTVYLTNMVAVETNGPGITFTFTIEGGTNGLFYDVFTTTSLLGNGATNATWTWLGQGTNCGTYEITNQPNALSFYVLGTPLMASDGSGLTQAYEALVHTNSSDGFSTPNAWYLAQGLNPQTANIGMQDPDGDGLLNWQEYLYGTNPLVSEGFAVWVSEPNGTSGIP